MMEFPIDTGAGDIIQRRSSYVNVFDQLQHDDKQSDVSTKSSAKRDENGAVILQFHKGGNQVLKLGADVDELEQERLLALMDERYMTWKHRWFSILEGRPHEFDENLSFGFNITSFTVVVISIVVFSVSSVPQVASQRSSDVDVNDPLFWIETCCIVYFSLEVLLRVYCVPFNILFTPLFVIDLVTIAGFFTDFFTGQSVSFLRVLRLLRVFRVMKISRYSKTLQLVFKVFAQSASGLSVLLMPIFLVVITSATVLYFIELATADWDTTRRKWYIDGRPAMFQSVFDGIWFTMATITTIGYGDFVPQTLAGKILASLLALFGVLTLSFPNLVLGANLESAFALHKRSAARTALSNRFRKVWLMIAYIRRSRVLVETRKIKEEQRIALELAAERNARRKRHAERRRNRGHSAAATTEEDDDDDNNFAKFGYHTIPPHRRLFPDMDDEPSDRAIGGSAVDRDRALFFELSTNQCASLVQGISDTIHDDNVRHWNYHGVTVRKLLQTLFEGWSGVATLNEIYQAYPTKDEDFKQYLINKKIEAEKAAARRKSFVDEALLRGSSSKKILQEQQQEPQEEQQPFTKHVSTAEDEEEEMNAIEDNNEEHEAETEGSKKNSPPDPSSSPEIPTVEEESATTLSPHDMALACMFLGAARYLDIFMFRRASLEFICCLTHKAVQELSLYPESSVLECRRSAEYARFIWKQTTGKITYFTHRSLSKTYAGWAAREKYAGLGTTADHSPDFKLHIGVTPFEIQELRRILIQRTTDLQVVIPDIDRFEGDAVSRYGNNNNTNGSTAGTEVPTPNAVMGRKNALELSGGSTGLFLNNNNNNNNLNAKKAGTSAGDDAAANEKGSGFNEVKLTLKLMLLHQQALMSERLGMPMAPAPPANVI